MSSSKARATYARAGFCAALQQIEGASRMLASEWLDHAAECRLVAQTIEDLTARRVLLEAAEDYEAMARRGSAVSVRKVPAFQAAAASRSPSSLTR